MKVEKSKKSSKGITLIALVITIIVLLILAGVSIATLTGENGILTRAGDAKTNTEIAEEKEAIGLAYNGVMAENRGDGVNAEDLEGELISNGYKATASGNIKVYFEDSKRWYKIDSNGNITGPFASEEEMGTSLVEMFLAGQNCTTENCQDETHLHVGDYLKYTPSNSNASTEDLEDNPLDAQYTGYSGEEQKYTVNSSTKWRVLGLSKDGKQLLLTTESPIQKDGSNPYLILQGAESYIYCEKVLDGICSIYSNSSLATEVRSMTMDDVTNALGITIDKEKNIAYKTADESETELPYQGFFGIPYEYKKNNYAPENYVIEKYGEQNYTKKTVGSIANYLSTKTGEIDNSAYMIPYTESSIVDSSSVIYDVLFSGTTEEDKYAKSYWLASPGVYVDSAYGYANFGPGAVNYGGAGSGYNLFYSYGDWYAGRLAVRPVVSLKSDISDADIERDVASNPEDDIWTGYDNSDSLVASGSVNIGIVE